MGGLIFHPGLSAYFRRLPPVAGLWLALLAAACAPAPSGAAAAGRIVDDAGDTVRLRGPVHRIVSLVPATTELLFAIGAGSSVVGRTAWCDYPAAARLVPSMGDGISPNLEAIVAARPDLVVLYQSAQNAEAARRLRALGIPALRLRTDRLADVPRLARLVGRLTAHERVADSVVVAFERGMVAATVPAAGHRPTIFLLVWDQPPATVGRGSFLTELMRRAGGVNLFDDLAPSSAPVSIEAVAARDPDVILLLGDASPAFASRPEWQSVRAVRTGRFIQARGSEFSWPSPRAPDAIRTLGEQLTRATR